MSPSLLTREQNAFAMLRQLARPRRAAEQCEFCSVALGAEHRHLFEPATRKIICACDACALRFENVVGRWKLIPRGARWLPGFQMSEAAWESLALPIQLAFLFASSTAQRMIALYPSPAGATESRLPLTNWEALASSNPCLAELQSDVEALLVNRLRTPPEYYAAPIDRCFELVGLIRLHWRGLSGGERVWREIDAFFHALRANAAGAPVGEVAHA